MMPFRPRTRRRSLHADEEGQISLLGVMAAAAFACLLLLVINTGYKTNAKIELQNAADLTAISGANWVARGLNVISLNNVTETQLVAFALILPALDSAMGKAGGNSRGGARIDVHEDTAALLRKLMADRGKAVPAAR